MPFLVRVLLWGLVILAPGGLLLLPLLAMNQFRKAQPDESSSKHVHAH